MSERRKVVSDPLPWIEGLSDEERDELRKKDRAKERVKQGEKNDTGN